MGADNYTGGQYERRLENSLAIANEGTRRRDAEIVRLKAKISALECELRIRKTREKERG